MIKFVLNLISKYEFIRFTIIGLCAAAIHYAVYLLFELYFGVNYNIAYVSGFAVSLSCNFFASNYFTFKTKPTVARAIKFASSHGCKVFMDLAFLNLFIWLGVPNTFAPICVFAIVFPISFILVRLSLKGVFKSEVK